MAQLVLGPVLRHVGARDATLWVETDAPCTVEVRRGASTGAQRTFSVGGHHFALVVLRGLAPGSIEAYDVLLDGDVAWPSAGLERPASVIRTLDVGSPVRLVFGSCRSPHRVSVRDATASGEDVLVAYARQLAGLPAAELPDALLMLGDQVYADETSVESVRLFATRRDITRPPYKEVANFEDFTQVYREAWAEPNIRWLLSTVPSSMIFDDHDVIDDWNTSASWRRDVKRNAWWPERIQSALASYWVYQHIGNLSPEQLDEDSLYADVRAAPDGADVLRRFAAAADSAADGTPAARWSYRRDYGNVRVLVVDSRAGRVLTEKHRSMLSDAEFEWLEQQAGEGSYDHLVIATSVPWLLPRALHDLESSDEALAAGSRGRRLAWLAERLRRAVDLEHWAAFARSFDRLARLIVRVGAGLDGRRPPASICVLSGDVHHTYASEATFATPMQARVYQLTCSPFHNSIPLPMRLVFLAAWTRQAQRWARWLARLSRIEDVGFDWRTTAGPYFGNHLAVLRLEGRTASFSLMTSAMVDGEHRAEPMDEAARALTTPGTPAEVPVHVAA